MPDPQLILDYASPRKRRRMRLPAKSMLTVTHGPDGSVRVVERLAGEAQAAVMAAAFGVFVAWMAGSTAARHLLWVLRHRYGPFDIIILGVLVLSGLA